MAAAVAQQRLPVVARAVLHLRPAVDHVDVLLLAAEVGGRKRVRHALADVVQAEVLPVDEQVDRAVMLIKHLRHRFRRQGGEHLVAEERAVLILGAAAQHQRVKRGHRRIVEHLVF